MEEGGKKLVASESHGCRHRNRRGGGGGIPLFFLLRCQGRGGWLTKLRGERERKKGRRPLEGGVRKGGGGKQEHLAFSMKC